MYSNMDSDGIIDIIWAIVMGIIVLSFFIDFEKSDKE